MAKPPNSTDSSASTSNHNRRASTHSLGVSYAYGSPTFGSPLNHQGSPSAAARGSPRAAHSSRASYDGGRAPSIDSGSTALGDEDSASVSSQAIGRSVESKEVRYGRIKQRTRDTGSPFPPKAPGATSVMQEEGSEKRNEIQPPLAPKAKNGVGNKPPSGVGRNDTSVNIATAFAQATKGAGSVVQGQRKEYPPPESMNRAHEGEEDEEEAGGRKETHVPGAAAGQSSSSKKRKKRSSKDPSFKPTGEPESESEGNSEDGLAHGKKKRTKTFVEEEQEQDEINTSVSNGAADSSTAKKARRKSGDATYRPSAHSEVESESEESDHARRRRKGKGRASGGNGTAQKAIPIGRRDNDVWMSKKRKGRKGGGRGGSGDGEDGEDDGEEEELGADDTFNFDPQPEARSPVVPASFFLRPKSPSPSAPTYQGHTLDSPPTAHSPFQPSKAITPDPAFRSFDRSFNSRARSESTDESGIRGSSYDYSEEERIVTALEKEKYALANGRTSGSSDGIRRRNRLPAPPSLNHLDEIQEEDEIAGGRFGGAVGAFVRPLWALVVRLVHKLQDPLLDWGRIGRTAGFSLLGLIVLLLLFAQPSSPPPAASPIPKSHSYSRFIPFFSPKPDVYATPDVPADSLAQLVSRLTVLERAMGQLSTISESERNRAERDRKAVNTISDQVHQLESSLEKESRRASKALEHSEAASEKEAREIASSVKELRRTLDLLANQVKDIAIDRRTDNTEIEKLKSGVEGVGKEIANLGVKVAQVAKDAQSAGDAERISAIVVEALESRLPSKLAVRLDSHGKLEIDPAFWKHLRDAFVERKEVDRLVSKEVATELAKRPASSGAAPAPMVVTKEPSWDDFLVANEASLRTWVNSDINSRVGSDAIVSRKTFLDILHREIKSLKSDFETKANENVEKIGREILDKVAKQEQIKKESGLASHLNPFHRSGSSSNTPSQVTIKTPDGQNLSAIIDSLVGSALLRYSKDVLARPDYALFTAGAHVVPSLTSPTYEINPPGLMRSAISWAWGVKSSRRPPVTALHPDNTPGSCWPFAGAQGQLGIVLSRRVTPTDITIEHISSDIAVDGDVSSAPKDFEVWAVVETKGDAERLARHRFQQLEARKAAQARGQSLDDEEASSVPPTPNHILLATGQYDISSASPIQTFPVTAQARHLGIPVQMVIFRFLSNNGDSAYTCVYRVRVSGVSEAFAAASAES
ncbi:hypothetical protein T439DRAFT_377231 [Meredithblackwellia eburnea MCA 4105]